MKRLLAHARGNVVAYLALFVALGGTSYAAVNLPKNSIGTKQLKRGAVTSVDVKNRALLRKDFKRGQLPRGATGPIGPVGPPGPPGTVDTSAFYDKATSDARFFQASGQRLVNHGVDMPVNSSGQQTVLEVPGFGRLSVELCTASAATSRWRNTSSATQPLVAERSASASGEDELGPNSSHVQSGGTVDVHRYFVTTGTAQVSVSLQYIVVNGSFCRFWATADVSR